MVLWIKCLACHNICYHLWFKLNVITWLLNSIPWRLYLSTCIRLFVPFITLSHFLQRVFSFYRIICRWFLRCEFCGWNFEFLFFIINCIIWCFCGLNKMLLNGRWQKNLIHIQKLGVFCTKSFPWYQYQTLQFLSHYVLFLLLTS